MQRQEKIGVFTMRSKVVGGLEPPPPHCWIRHWTCNVYIDDDTRSKQLDS
jgi:hypothetical protein